MSTDQDNLAARFLLGKLGEEEAFKLEEDYFQSTPLFEEMLAAENDLIDAYATGRLSSEDRRRFENRLLLSAPQRQRLQFARTLVKYAASQSLTAADFGSQTVKTSWISAVSRLFSGRALFSLSFAAAALILSAGGLWLVIDKSVPIAENNEIAGVETPAPSMEPSPTAEIKTPNEAVSPKPTAMPPQNIQPTLTKQENPLKKAPSAVYSLILTPGLTRAAGTSRRFSIPAKTDFVKMSLRFEPSGFSSYHAALETVEGRQLWRGKLKSAKAAGALEVSIPANLLRRGDYILTLKGVTKEGADERVEDYPFTIDR